MRLLDTHTGRFIEMNLGKEHFKYAILSHTWDPDGEQTYQELKKIQELYAAKSWFPKWRQSHLSRIWKDRRLSPKVLNACAVARKEGYRYIWIDSCCIDKTSSSELSEAINSMYAWYEQADICYAYLADVPPDEDPHQGESRFRKSRWFKRGWTLQELIAPRNLTFLAKDWTPLGSKKVELAELVKAVTDISIDVLREPFLVYRFSVAQRLSWAAGRETTRVEDRAYSLLGIFDISMPTLYGEGSRAFLRLQEEILRGIPDQSLFAWGDTHYFGDVPADDPNAGPPRLQLGSDSAQDFTLYPANPASSSSLLSTSPDSFVGGRSIEAAPLSQLFYHYPDLSAPDYTFTSLGIRTKFPLIPLSAFLPEAGADYWTTEQSEWYLLVLGCEHVDHPGHLLARVCRLPSSQSAVQVLSGGSLNFILANERGAVTTELVVLSPEVLARSSPLATIATVFLSRPRRPTETHERNPFDLRPHKTIHLLLRKKTETTTLESHGSRLPLAAAAPAEPAPIATVRTIRWPGGDHPFTHWLTISRPRPMPQGTEEDAITIKYRHTLEDGGHKVTINAHLTGTLHGHPIVPVITSWGESSRLLDSGWGRVNGDRKRVVVDNGKDGKAEVELSLEFLALNHYVIDAHAEWSLVTTH